MRLLFDQPIALASTSISPYTYVLDGVPQGVGPVSQLNATTVSIGDGPGGVAAGTASYAPPPDTIVSQTTGLPADSFNAVPIVVV